MVGAQRLCTNTTSSTQEADEVFGKDPGMLVALPGRNIFYPWIIIPESYYALVTTSGSEQLTSNGSPVWPSGFMSAGPFTKVSHLVTKGYTVFDVPVKGCKTKDNVSVSIDCSIVFRIMGDVAKNEDPELVRKFVHEVTPSGLEQQLKDAMAEEVRTLARSMKHTVVYSCRSGAAPTAAERVEAGGGGAVMGVLAETSDMSGKGAAAEKEGAEPSFAPSDGGGGGGGGGGGDAAAARPLNQEELDDQIGIDVTREMEQRLNEQFMPQGVMIHDIMIQNISLPDDINQQMSNKTLVRSHQEYEVMQQNFEMQSIRLKNETAKLKLGHREEQEMARTTGQKDIQGVRDGLLERQAVREKFLNDFKQGTVTAVSEIVAESKEKTTTLEFEYEKTLQTFKLKAEEEAATIKADAAAKIEELQAETQYGIAQSESEATKAIAEAEAKSNEYLLKARQFQVIDRQLDVYQALVRNPATVVTDSVDKDFQQLLLADSVLSGQTGGQGGHASILSELNLMRLAGSAYGLRSDTYIPGKGGGGRMALEDI